MPGSTVTDPPTVALSFANNFWGKDDAGVTPLLDRMHGAKVTGEELKAFYSARAAIEDEYARKLLNLARKPLGSSEVGTLRFSLDCVRGEVESMGKAHQNNAQQMKTELDEALTAFVGSIKERRKIVQVGIDKLYKTKQQQTTAVNKARDRYQQDCLKIKGYLAQGHMVMGQEERKNKAKLEKTQIQMSTASNEYETAVKALEETTGRWNKEWKAACDKFQDLEEERIDYMKSSLWTFANIASTVCVSDDASCEKIRLSLEQCEVEKDIKTYIDEYGTGQEIPDPPKYINFAAGELDDNTLGPSDEDAYSVAQFQRTMNPAFRSSSPQPSTYESHHEPHPELGKDSQVENQTATTGTQDFATKAPQKPYSSHQLGEMAQEEYPEVPHNEYPMDGMTQFCRSNPPSSAQSSALGSNGRPSSRDSQSEYSNPTSFSSQEPSSVGARSPIKSTSDLDNSAAPEFEAQKKKSGIFQNRSPFGRKKSRGEINRPQPSKSSTWAPSTTRVMGDSNRSPQRGSQHYGQQSNYVIRPEQQPSASPEPVDPRANFQLNVGNNCFDVASPDAKGQTSRRASKQDELDPIAQALADLKGGVSKQSSMRMSADRYAGMPATPGSGAIPGRSSNPPSATKGQSFADRTRQRGESPPPSYDQPEMSRLGAPQPAFTSRQMQQTTQKYVDQKQNMFNSPGRYGSSDQHQPSQRTTPQSRPGTRGSSGQSQHSRATSPIPFRSTSPRPGLHEYQAKPGPARATSPSPSYQAGPPSQNRPRAQSTSPIKPRGENFSNEYSSYQGPPSHVPRATSPQPQFSRSQGDRPGGRGGNMAMQLAPAHGTDPYGAAPLRGRPGGMQGGNGRPMSQYGAGGPPPSASSQYEQRTRSKSVADGKQYTRDGQPILQFSRAVYMYQAAIPEELSFAKGDILAIVRMQDDGWWEAEVCGKRGRPGLVPSNYLTNC